MATSAAMAFLSLFRSPHNGPLHPFTMSDAFILPQSAARLPHRISSHVFHSSEDNGEISRDLVHSSPIRTNQNQLLVRLTHQQEVSLLRRMRSHPTDSSISQMARQTLLLHNLPLVQSIVTKILTSRPHLNVRSGGGQKTAVGNNGSNTGNDYSGGSQRTQKSFVGSSAAESRVGTALTRDDLLHEGTIGLAEAIDRYDLIYVNDDVAESATDSSSTSSSDGVVPKGARLGTYATYWIRARILRAIQSREHAVRFPEHALQASHRLVKAAKEMGLEWQYVATELADYDVISVAQKRVREELREKAGIASEGLFRDAVRVRTMSRFGGTTPLESWMSPSSTSATADSGEEDDEAISSEAGQEHILETLSKFLIPREVEVLSLRFGLGSAEEDVENNEEAPFFRNYQAEAEEGLFGPDGVLSHYSMTPNEDVSVAVAATTSKSTKVEVEKKTRNRTPTLLPFKEIGKRMKFSGEYCRRTCTVALSKLTRAAEEGRLAESDFLLGW